MRGGKTRYSLEFEYFLVCKYHNVSFEYFDDLRAQRKSELIAAYRTAQKLEAVQQDDMYRQRELASRKK